MRDALTGRPRISNDRHYVTGYDLGNRLKPSALKHGSKGEDKDRH